MTTRTDELTPWERLVVAGKRAGRTVTWLAAELHMNPNTLRYKMQEQAGYAPLAGWEKARLASLVETSVEAIWPAETEATADSPVTVTDDDGSRAGE